MMENTSHKRSRIEYTNLKFQNVQESKAKLHT